MSIMFRALLILASLVFAYLSLANIRKGKLQIEASVFWLALSCLFVVLSIFPQLTYVVARFLGVASPVNFVFLVVIALLLYRVLKMSIQIASLEDKVKILIQDAALKEFND